jgi:hypothetical protein
VTWLLSFRHPQSLAIEDCERVLSVLVGPVSTTLGDLVGNPRDFYTRDVVIGGVRDDLELSLRATQSLRGDGDPEAYIGGVYVQVIAPYATKLVIWKALAESFAAIGCRDETPMNASAIVDDADAAGDSETSARVRALVLDTLIADARTSRWVRIISPRIDIEPVLAAYVAPEDISSMTLHDCGLRAMPTSFARFSRLRSLELWEPTLDASVLVRGMSLPELSHLVLINGARLAKDDLAGFPALEHVVVNGVRWSP